MIESAGQEIESIIEDALGGQPRAAYWRELRLVLADRLKSIKVDRDELSPETPERIAIEKRIHEIREQIDALGREEAVTQFLEDSIRSSLLRPIGPGGYDFSDEFDEFDEAEGY